MEHGAPNLRRTVARASIRHLGDPDSGVGGRRLRGLAVVTGLQKDAGTAASAAWIADCPVIARPLAADYAHAVAGAHQRRGT